MPLTKRFRGAVLRLVLRRAVAITLGLALLIPSALMMLHDFPWENSATDGLGLIVGATGAALFFAGVGGRRPDWQD